MADRRYRIHYTGPDGLKAKTHETEDVEHIATFDVPARQYAGVPLERNAAYLKEIGATIDFIEWTEGDGPSAAEVAEAG